MSLWGGKPLWSGYRLVRIRGKGGFGQVWEVDTADGERVALKFLQCGDHFAAAEEVRNIQRIRQLSHPNFVRIDKVWADRGYVVLAMELAEGSLADLLNVARDDFGGALPSDLVCEHLTQAARALDFLNERQHALEDRPVGIQHGDVKPGNLLLCGDRIKLCDFGLSRVMTDDVVSHRRSGTLAYAAPEVFRGQISRWADQFSLAVTYYELRTGKFPFPPMPTDTSRSYERPAPDLTHVTEGERTVLARALSVSQHERWPSCSAMMTELSKAVTSPETTATKVRKTPTSAA